MAHINAHINPSEPSPSPVTIAPADNMTDYRGLPPDVILFGPDGNCTLEICPVEASLYGYRPSLSASIAFIVLYALAACIHIYLGWRWKKWFFMIAMVLGALNAIAGYTGRIILYNNPFDFSGFMLQIGKKPPLFIQPGLASLPTPASSVAPAARLHPL